MKLLRLNHIHRIVRKFFTNKLRQKIFFMHIPKCGGTSIGIAIRQCYGVSKKQKGNSFFQLDSPASLNVNQVSGVREIEFLENLLIYNMSIESRKYIDGHFVYSERAYSEFKDQWAFITILRHPVSKWFSKYFFNRYKESMHYKLDCDLETYLESKTGIAEGSDYVRCLTGLSLAHDSTSEKAVEHAIRNLDNFTVVGILEKMDLFVKDFESQFGTKLYIEHLRKNPLSKTRQEQKITDRIKERVEEICQPDIQIYEAALERVKSKSE